MKRLAKLSSYFSAYIVLALLGACSKPEPSNVETGTAEQVIHYGNGDEPKSIDPHLTTGSPDSNIIKNLLEGLVTKNAETLVPEPAVAQSWEISDDGKQYTFHIRPDARWSNGEPVTAEDFVQSYKRALMPTLPNEYAYMLFYIEGAKEYYDGDITDFSEVGVSAIDPHTLQINLKNPTSFFLQLLDHHSYYPVPVATIEKFGDLDDASSKWILPGNFVGNGPFVLEDWQINKVITLAKSHTYWGKDDVKLKKAHFYPIEDQQAEERAFRTGKIHLTHTPQMDIEKVAVYREKNHESLRITQTYSSYYYELNITKPPLDNVKVRQALAYAIDRDLIVNNVTKAGETPAYSVIPPDPEGYSPKEYFHYDVEQAKALLAEAGYPNGEGFPGFTILYNTHDNHRKVALAIQQMLKANLNIDVQIENKEWKVYMAARDNMEHEIARAGWIADFVDAINFFDIFRSYSGNNHTGWSSERYDDLLTQIEASSDPSQRYALFEQANKLLFEDMPVIPIYYYSDVNLVSPVVKNWFDNVLHYHPLRDVYLESSAAEN